MTSGLLGTSKTTPESLGLLKMTSGLLGMTKSTSGPLGMMKKSSGVLVTPNTMAVEMIEMD
jgi:hypothetical protein